MMPCAEFLTYCNRTKSGWDWAPGSGITWVCITLCGKPVHQTHTYCHVMDGAFPQMVGLGAPAFVDRCPDGTLLTTQIHLQKYCWKVLCMSQRSTLEEGGVSENETADSPWTRSRHCADCIFKSQATSMTKFHVLKWKFSISKCAPLVCFVIHNRWWLKKAKYIACSQERQ